MSLSLLFLILAALCFFLKTINVAVWKLDLLALGLLFFVIGMIL